jgi:undecaprenyl diphosphate synthase
MSDVPAHVAVIMDGNGRWARKRGLPRHAGHRAGVKSVRATVEAAAQRGIRYLTLFAFSSENWGRPKDEVSKLMGLFFEALRREVDELHRNNVKLRFVGARRQLNDGLIAKIEASEAKTSGNTGLELLIAVAYGGRWDIAQAARTLAERACAGDLAVDDIDETAIADELQLAGVPDPDLLIRTGGEKRISNFLLWNLAYSELHFPEVLWPDFTDKHLDEALQMFSQRERRYGHTGDQVKAIGC